MRGRSLKLSMAVLIAALAVSLAIFIGGCGSKKSTSSGPLPIKVGAIVSLTGPYAALGQPEKNTLDMEVKKINDAGGINGHPIDLIVKDDGTDDAKAVAAANELISQDKVVAILGPTGSSATMAIRGNIDRAGIPEISMAAATPITYPVDKLVFATAWPNSIVVPFDFAYMKKQGITKIGVISDTGGFGADGLAVIKAAAPKMGMTVVDSETFNQGDTDMTAQLTKIKNTNAQAVLMWTAGPEATTIAKELQDLGMKIPLYGSHGNGNLQFIQGAGAAANGFMFPAGKILVPAAYGKGSAAYTAGHRLHRRLQGGVRYRRHDVRWSRVRRHPHPGRRGADPERRRHRIGAARRDRADQGIRRHQRRLHLLAHRPQRHDPQGAASCTRSSTASGRSPSDTPVSSRDPRACSQARGSRRLGRRARHRMLAATGGRTP